MAAAWVHLVCLVSIALSGMWLAEGKKPWVVKKLTNYEIAALGAVPTCCPDNPLSYCDFYFDGHMHKMPTFHIKDNFHGDHPVSIVDTKHFAWKGWLGHFSPSVRDSKSGQLAYVSSTWRNGSFLQCEPLPPWVNTGDQFFISPVGDGATDNNGAKLHVRTWQRATPHQHGQKFYFGRCILLPMTEIQIPTEKGNLNLAHGDGNLDYPEKRRCVTFKTAR